MKEQEKTVESLELAANVFSEVAYNYFASFEREGKGDLQVMVKVDDTNVVIQLDKEQNKLIQAVKLLWKFLQIF